MMKWAADALFVIGVVLVAAGLWQWVPPLALMWMGGVCVWLGWEVAKWQS